MLRRSALTSSLCLIACGRSFGSTRCSRGPADPAEVAREQELRNQIVQKYKGMSLPPLTDFTYGKFAAGSTSSASSQSVFSQFAASASNNSSSGGGGSSSSAGGAAGSTPVQGQGVDWLMLLTGTALVFVTSRLLADRLNGPKASENMQVPLWCATFEMQAKYLLLLVGTDKGQREALQQEFERVRAGYPMLNFFDWLEVRYPALGNGFRYSRQQAVEVVKNMLSQGTQLQLATAGRATSYALSKGGSAADGAARIDEYVDQVNSAMGGARLPPAVNPYAAYIAPSQQVAQYPPQAYPVPPSGFNMAHSPYASATAPHVHGGQDVTLTDVLSSVQGRENSASDPRQHLGLAAPMAAPTAAARMS